MGGQVITPVCQPARLKGKPGCISWYGKHWGNIASLQGDSPIEVEGVMEGNCAWRRQLLASLQFDPILNFDDAVMYGLDLCLQAKGKGLRVFYEPRAVVFHHAAQRAPDLDRNDRPRRIFSYTRNYTYIMLKRLPWWRRPIFLAWWFFVGERTGWGLGAVLADALMRRTPPPRDVWGAFRGKVEGVRVLISRRPSVMQRTMKILIYSHAFAPNIGGVETIVMLLAQGLVRHRQQDSGKGVQVTVVTPTPAGGMDDAALPFRVVRQPSVRMLLRLIRAADVIHLAGPAFLPLLAGLLLRKPVVVEHHGFHTICPNGQLLHEPTQKPCPGHFMAGRHGECYSMQRPCRAARIV